MIFRPWIALAALVPVLVACPEEIELEPISIYAEVLGDPIPGLDADQMAQWDRGRQVMSRLFTPGEGLGPLYNGESCDACHHFPVPGGAATRHRDVFLMQRSEGGQRTDLGTDPDAGPLRSLYSVGEGHRRVPDGVNLVARRAPLPTLGVGLFEFVSDEEILSRVDPRDTDGDGISGRAQFLGDTVGRYGYKAQSGTMLAVVRTALREQLGITSPAIEWTAPLPGAAWNEDGTAVGSLFDLLINVAYAHPHNNGMDLTSDEDAIADPEISAGDLEDLVHYMTFLAPPNPAPPGEIDAAGLAMGEALFGEIGCERCHVPELDSALGPIKAYTDLLLHDMGDGLGRDIPYGNAEALEFRTPPLWAPRLYVPYLRDSSAPAYEFVMLAHGGEAQASALAYAALSDEQRGAVQQFLDSLGGWNPKGRFLAPEGTPIPPVGSLGGPDRELSAWERSLWAQGRDKFDRMTAPSFDSGLGAHFNADSCRACHKEPVLGGAGRNDVNTLLMGTPPGVPQEGSSLGSALPRSVITRVTPFRPPDSVDVVEPRSAPSILGLGVLERVPAADVLANADPDDLNGDGISGRARILGDGRLGRFGWTNSVPTIVDFTASALLSELSITVETRYTDYTTTDDGDWYRDPELADRGLLEMSFYLAHLAPPPPQPASGDVEGGRALFATFGCDSCHLPDLGGLPAYTDLLLHDVANPDAPLAGREPDILPTEFRTPPLWGVVDTFPYMNDGGAATLHDSVLAHFGEGAAAKAAYGAASTADQAALVAFIESL